jgi:signal transduction histidine kinase
MVISDAAQHDHGKAHLVRLQEEEEEPVSRLAASVAHEIINYLAVIDGYANLLLIEADDSAAGRGRINEIVNATQRSLSLSKQLLALERQQAVHREALCVNQVITGVEDALRYLVGDNIKLTMECAPNTGLVWADPGQIEQILLNLVSNARDAIPDTGTITIRIANVEDDQVGRAPASATSYVMISVSDTGTGISEKTQARLFEPFFTTKQDGTGLGLYTVREIVTQNNGCIRIQSELGHGTRSEVLLPQIS